MEQLILIFRLTIYLVQTERIQLEMDMRINQARQDEPPIHILTLYVFKFSQEFFTTH
jgi:hypothetical protein